MPGTESATQMCKPHVDRLAPAMLNAIARHLCAVFGGREDVRKFDAQAERVYLQCIRCLRTTRGYSSESAPHHCAFPECSGRARGRPCAFVGLSDGMTQGGSR